MLPLNIIGPGIAVAVNLSLGIWALARGFRSPAYRLFALFAFSLILWNVGQRFPHGPRDPAIWLRLAFLGMSLAPAAFLSLAISALDPSAVGRYWRMLLFLPAILAGILTPVSAEELAHHRVGHGFYIVAHDAAIVFAAFAVIYIGAGLIISCIAARRRAENNWVFHLVLMPLAVGLILTLGSALLRREAAPTSVFWMMAMAQAAMFLMLRFKMVSLEVGKTRRTVAAFTALVVAACVLLLAGIVSLGLDQPMSQEIGLVLVISIVSLLVLYAAVVPMLEEFADVFFKRK